LNRFLRGDTIHAMINIETQIRHWRDSSLEELEVSRVLIAKKHVRQGLFWAHLTLEKMLKAHVCKQTGDLAPRIHNLVRLSELAGLDLAEDEIKFLGQVNDFNLEGRYGEYLGAVPELKQARGILRRVEEMLTWLNGKL